MKKRIFCLITLLLTMATQGAWAEWTGGTYTATANETRGSITVTYNATLFINEGVTVTVNGNENRIGINIKEGCTLTIAGPGTLVVKGADGNGAYIGDYGAGFGGNGYTAISGSIIVQGATVNVTGGHGNNGPDKSDQENAYNGGNGGAAFSGAVTIHSGTINAHGGNGGAGGHNFGYLYGGAGGNGGNAFTGTLTYYGGTVNAQGGGFGTGGSNSNNEQSGNGTEGKAFASSVNFQNTPTTLTDGSSNIEQTAETNHKTVNISGSDVPVLPSADASGDYLISSIYDWNTFANAVSTGATFSGKTVKLANDLSGVTMKAGSDTKPFSGTFDGQEHTLTVNITSLGSAAPFAKVDGATIQKLIVAGSVTTSMTDGADHTAGLIGKADGTVTVNDVRVSATVTGLTYYSGFIANGGSSTINMTGCVFDGQLMEKTAGETQYAGGFIGWGGNMTITMNDCLFAGTSTIAASGSGARNFLPVGFYGTYNTSLGSLNLNNVYTTAPSATHDFPNHGAALSNGEKQAYSITAADANVTTLAISGNAVANYTVSGLKRYASGIEYGSTLYAANGESVSLTLAHADAEAGQHFSSYAVSGGGSLTAQTETSATLSMTDANQTISAEYADNASHNVSFVITETGWSTTPSGTAREGETVTVSYTGKHKVKIVEVKDKGAQLSTISEVTMTGTKDGDTYSYSGTFTMSTVDMYVQNLLYYKLGAEETLADYQTTYNNQTTGNDKYYFLDRTLTKNVWNTFSSPFAIASGDMEKYFGAGTKVRKLDNTTIDGNLLNLNFVNASSIEAGKPYIVKPTAANVDFSADGKEFEGVNLSPASASPDNTTYVNFVPTVGKTTVTGNVEDILMMTIEGKLAHPTAVGDMKGFRGYFVMHDAPVGARAFRIDFGDGESTGIIPIRMENGSTKADGMTFDLQGRKVTQPTKKGIYIQNGKKVIVK